VNSTPQGAHGEVKDGEEKSPSKSMLKEAVSGAIAGCVARLCTGPLDVIKIRFQVQIEPISSAKNVATPLMKSAASKYTSFHQALISIIREEGVQALWRGTVPGLLLTVPYTAVQFVVLSQTKDYASRMGYTKNPRLSTVSSLLCGATAGAAATMASYPFDLLRTTLAAQGEPRVYKNMLEAAYGITRQRGPFGLFSGLGVTLLEILPYSALQFGMYDLFNHLVSSSRVQVALAARRHRIPIHLTLRSDDGEDGGGGGADRLNRLDSNSKGREGISSLDPEYPEIRVSAAAELLSHVCELLPLTEAAEKRRISAEHAAGRAMLASRNPRSVRDRTNAVLSPVNKNGDGGGDGDASRAHLSMNVNAISSSSSSSSSSAFNSGSLVSSHPQVPSPSPSPSPSPPPPAPIPPTSNPFSSQETAERAFAAAVYSDAPRWQHFTCGFLAGTLAKLASHPLDVAKKRYQVAGLSRSLSYGARVDSAFAARSLGHSLVLMYQQEGLLGLWKGSLPSVIKAAPSAAITLTVYEVAMKWMRDRDEEESLRTGGAVSKHPPQQDPAVDGFRQTETTD